MAMDLRATTATALACLAITCGVRGEEWRLDPTAPDAAEQWEFRSDKITFSDQGLGLDSLETPRKQQIAFLKTPPLAEVTLSASFVADPAGKGVHAVGFVVGARDSLNYHYVHYDHSQAILCRSDDEKSWWEIGRRSGLDKPEGKRHTAKLVCRPNVIEVWLNGTKLYEKNCPALTPGRVVFYTGQGRATVRDIVVSGRVVKAEAWSWRERPKHWVIVCEDGGNGGYEAFPDATRLADGRILAVFYDGYGHVSIPRENCPSGGRISGVYSDDEGKTWGEPVVLYDGPKDDRDPHVTELRDGRLMITFFCHRTHDIPGWRGALLIESADGGATWTKPRELAPVPYYVCSAPVRELSDGTLVLGLYRSKGGKAWGAVIRSTDGGKTWSSPADIDSSGMRLDAETDVVELKNGHLFAALRGRKQMAWSRSEDRGVSWSPAVSFGFSGHCPYFLRTPQDVILLAHRIPATSLHYSTDECRTWNGPVTIDRVGGAYPSLVNLKDGSVLCVYYEEGAGSSIRACRLDVSPDGVRVAPLQAEGE